MKQKIQPAIIVILILILVYMISGNIHLKKTIKQHQKNERILAGHYKFEIDKKDSQAVYQQQVIIDKNSELAELSDSIRSLKNLQSQTRIVTKTVYQKDTVEIPDQFQFTIDSTSYLALPFKFGKDLKWARYHFTFTQDFDIITDTLVFQSDFIVLMGYEKKFNLNPFNKNKPIVYFRDKNPYTKVTQMQNVVIDDFKPRRISIGIQAGYGVSKHGLGPHIGIGVNYSLLQF